MQPSLLVVRNRIGWLGQADKVGVTFRLLVKDLKDRGFSGVEWDIVPKGAGEMSISGRTNGGGSSVVNFATTEDSFSVRVHLPEGMVTQDMSVKDAMSQVMTMRSVQEAPQPIINTMEIVAGSAGILLSLIGLYSKMSIIERVGETMIMATVFYRVGRAVI